MLIWGAAFSVTEVALRHTTPAFTAFARGFFGFLVMLPFLGMFGSRLPRTARLWVLAAAMGFGGTTLSLLGLAEGTARAGPAIAAVLLNTAPFFVALIGRLALAERVTALRAFGLVVGFAGVLVIVLAGDSSSGEDVVIGSILTLLGAFGYACAGLIVRYLVINDEPFDVLGITAAQFLCGSVLLLPYLFLSGDVGASDWGSGELWWSIAFIVIGAQVAGLRDVQPRAHALAGVARVPVDVPLAGDRDRDRGHPRPPAGRTVPTLGMAIVVARRPARQPARRGGAPGHRRRGAREPGT